MASQTLSQIQANKEEVLQKLRDAQANLAEAYKETKLTEIADVIVDIGKVIYDIEQDL